MCLVIFEHNRVQSNISVLFRDWLYHNVMYILAFYSQTLFSVGVQPVYVVVSYPEPNSSCNIK